MFTFDIASLNQNKMFLKRKPLLSNNNKKRKQTYLYSYYICLIMIIATCTIICIKALIFKNDLNVLNMKNLNLVNEQEIQKTKNENMDKLLQQKSKEKEAIIKKLSEQKNLTETKQQELEQLKKQSQLRNAIHNDLYHRRHILPWKDFHPFDHWLWRFEPFIPI